MIENLDFGLAAQSPASAMLTICAWRGACIEVFARAEHSVADCLAALDAAGVPLDPEARSPAPANRLKALRRCLESHTFGGHEREALRRLGAWQTVFARRAWIAHGVFVAAAGGITVRHRSFDGKREERHPPERLSWAQLLALLARFDERQRALHQQLSQIRKFAGAASGPAA